ncbi:FkbM family methyltransferase [Flavisolibacter nicotianae]|uniref:FkbM family methyltransferase n=1 Tax=Flavisolibacter nicotianae TaxID=2364882 RepID=UPI000EAE9AA7|nr:FkbM family methyltransferase [Flavisolibacter nicotianae]
MGEVTNILKKIAKKAAYQYSTEAREIGRIKKIPRYQNGETNLLGGDFRFVDSASFIGQYFSVLNGSVYKFRADTDEPLIIDCGANIGMSILYFKKLYPKARIIAFEPDKKIFSTLEKNVEARGFRNVTLVNKGVWNTEGTLRFRAEGADGGSIVGENGSTAGDVAITEIETTSLKPYLEGKVDFLKLDIEGAEAVVIEDCKDLLQNVQHLFIEYHSIANEPQRLDEILRALRASGFRYYIESAIINNRTPFLGPETLNNFDNFLNIYANR